MRPGSLTQTAETAPTGSPSKERRSCRPSAGSLNGIGATVTAPEYYPPLGYGGGFFSTREVSPLGAETGTFKWKGRFGPFDLRVSENTFAPSTISVLLAESLEIDPGDTVVDVGCGSGVLSIIAAKLGAGRVFGVDAATDVVEVASENAARHGVGETTTFFHGDLFEPLPEGLAADVVIGDVSGIPDAIAATSGWFPSMIGGGPRGSELPIRMLEGVQGVLHRGGRFFLPTGTLQDEAAILDKARSVFGKLTQVAERAIPLPTALSQSAEVIQLVRSRVIELTQRGSRMLWTAKVWKGSLA